MFYLPVVFHDFLDVLLSALVGLAQVVHLNADDLDIEQVKWNGLKQLNNFNSCIRDIPVQHSFKCLRALPPPRYCRRRNVHTTQRLFPERSFWSGLT